MSNDGPKIDGQTMFITLLGVLLMVFVGFVSYTTGRTSLITEMKNYGCEKVLGYVIH